MLLLIWEKLIAKYHSVQLGDTTIPINFHKTYQKKVENLTRLRKNKPDHPRPPAAMLLGQWDNFDKNRLEVFAKSACQQKHCCGGRGAENRKMWKYYTIFPFRVCVMLFVENLKACKNWSSTLNREKTGDWSVLFFRNLTSLKRKYKPDHQSSLNRHEQTMNRPPRSAEISGTIRNTREDRPKFPPKSYILKNNPYKR